ncbi:MAG: hypothetical protein LQ342_008264 [Letrouitia transgressa]|nr:MAG: hypothetical protein LQ342_008264 [Letrouitia transgressa]
MFEFMWGRDVLNLRLSWLVPILFFTWLIGLGVYRVYFSSLARIPGPRLAALTTWYQGYYDVFCRGQYVWRIKEMHTRYGPIVRINPHEIHINDPEFIDEIFAGPSKPRDKYRWISRMLGTPRGLAGTLPHDVHRIRRAAVNPYFSKASVRRLEPVIQGSLSRLLNRMSAASTSGEIMRLPIVFKALTCDIIQEYAFGTQEKHMNREDYNLPFFEAVAAFIEGSHLLLHCAWVGPLTKALPIKLTHKLLPAMAGLYEMQQGWIRQIEDIRSEPVKEMDEKTTIFHGLLRSDLPDEEKSTGRLTEEAQLIVFAGTDTTATTLAACTYHLLANPEILRKLKAELETALPNADDLPTSAQVEALPWLNAIIQEGLRLHPGSAIRLQRVSKNSDLVYTDRRGVDWTIPAGTPVSMTPTLVHSIPEYWENPYEFRPERWIENPKLSKYLLSFAKGTRICLG